MLGWIREDGHFILQPINILDGWTVHEGKEFTAN
jgi:hypothetical protein